MKLLDYTNNPKIKMLDEQISYLREQIRIIEGFKREYKSKWNKKYLDYLREYYDNNLRKK